MIAPRPLGIIAGSGDLPRMVVEQCQRDERPFFVVAFEGETSPETTQHAPHVTVPIHRIGSGLRELEKRYIRELVLVGRVARPRGMTVKPDFTTIRLMTQLLAAQRMGDDSVLGGVIRFLEARGYHVHGVQEVIQDILTPHGVMGSHQPDARAQKDISLGVEVARHVGLYDIGQAVVVQAGHVLGVEAAEGTDALMARMPGLQNDQPGGVLVKMCKPRQDVRVDLPAVGPETVRNAAKAGLRGIALEAGKSLMIHREEMIAEADRLGLFLYGVQAG